MAIDINRRLLIWYGFINILNTITQLSEQLPISLMNEVRDERRFVIEEQNLIVLAYVDSYLYNDFVSFNLDVFIRFDIIAGNRSSNQKFPFQSFSELLPQSSRRAISSKTPFCTKIVPICVSF